MYYRFSNRKSDESKEHKLYSFVDEIYKENGIGFVRNNDVNLQKHGVDGFAKFDNCTNILFVDEKAAIKYWNRDLPTFSFEIFSNRMIQGELLTVDGWFNNDNKYVKTTHYSIIWVRSDDSDLNKINSIEVCIVSKEDLWRYISCFGINNSKELFDLVKNEPVNFGIARKEITDTIRVVWSKNIIPEKPVCVTIRKDVLINLSVFHTKKIYN